MRVTNITATLTKAPKDNCTVLLKRTYNQPLGDGTCIKFWRVIGPSNHPNLNSDLSIAGLLEWGVI